jgi:UDP-N-acetylmuramate dehydrogenase
MQNINMNNENQILYKSSAESFNQKSKLMKMKKIFLLISGKCIIILLLLFFTLHELFNYLNKNQFLKISILSKKSVKANRINEEFINNLKNILKTDEIIENEILSKHTTFKLGGSARFFVKPKTINQIMEIIQLCNKYKVNYFILGNGSNLLVSDQGYYGVVIQIHEHNFSSLDIKKQDDDNYRLIVGAGMLMKTLSIEACLLSLTGLEDIIDIPGTVGGGIIMNASFRGTGLFAPLIKVKVISPEGKVLDLTKEECKLTHRGSMLKTKKYIVIEAMFKLKKGDQMIIQKKMTNNTERRYKKQPMYFGSAGCFFVWDHNKHGSMYEKYKESNLVGYRVGNIMIYTYNISFIVNLGKGTSSQVMEIVQYIEKIMKEKYKIKINREVVLIGTFNDIEYY